MTESFIPLRDRWFDRLLGPGRPAVPTSSHMGYMRRLSPLESTYTKERATEVCLATLRDLGFDLAAATNIKLDIEDRPQKAPRACVIPSNPPSVVHLITRAQGGLHDYQAFLHEAGHALHYGGVDPVAAARVPQPRPRPRADRDLLLHRRGDLEGARVACPLLRPLGRRGRPERRGDDVPRGDPLPPLRGEAPLRARVLGPLRRGRRHPRRLRGVPHRRDRRPLPQLALPLRHGRRLLLRRLPPRLGPLRPAPPLPDRHGRRGLVAQPRDRRVPARRCSSKERSPRARTSPRRSATTRSTRRRSSTSSAPDAKLLAPSGPFV